jgi:hypothetical membrane protein
MSGGTGTRSGSSSKFLALSGVIGPILFTIVVIILGLLRPDYSHVSEQISKLGEVGAPNAAIQDANFIVFGLLVVVFAYGLHKGIGDGRGSRIGPILIGIGGMVGFMGAGVFSLPSPIHAPVSIIGLTALMVATFAISRRLKRDSRWHSYGSYSLIFGGIAVVLFLVVFIAGPQSPWFGLIQRLFIAPLFVWLEIMALHLARISNRPVVQSA